MHGKGEGVHGKRGGVFGWHVWQGGMHAGEMATEAGGTHPTGMHSCFTHIFQHTFLPSFK